MLSIINNTSSMQAQQALGNTSNTLSTSLQRLSTGLKINSGADGPAALVISQAQQAQIAGLNTAIDNTNQAVSLVQTGEGALGEVNNLLTQVRSLALNSANSGVNDANALAANQAQIANALNTINQIANNTQFNGKQLLDGSSGYNAVSSNTSVTGLSSNASTTLGTYTLTITQAAQKGQVDVSTGANTATALGKTVTLGQDENLTFNGTTTVALKAGMTNTQVAATINAATSQTGVVASLDSTSGNLVLTDKTFGKGFQVVSDVAAATAGATGVGTTSLDTTAAAAGIVSKQAKNIAGSLTNPDASTTAFTGVGNVVTMNTGPGNGMTFTVAADPADAAKTDAAASGASIVASDGSLTFQIGANAGQTANLSIAKMTTDALGTGVANNQFTSLAQIDVTTTKGAQDSLGIIDAAISQVSNLRGSLGAFQSNTLQANAINLQTALTNTSAAAATITNTDFASEISKYTQLQTQLSAGSTVLSNANQSTQLIAQLLQRA